jgi:hypothetical protein
MLTEEDKQALLGIIDAEMFLKTLTINAFDANIKEVGEVIAEVRQ